MLYNKSRRGQSILEYAILIGVVVSGLLIMQSFVKRHYQGGLKESAEKMGEAFSASGTTTFQKRTMTKDQDIIEETATTAGSGIGKIKSGLTGTLDKDIYSYTSRTGGDMTAEQSIKTDSAKLEKYKIEDHSGTEVEDFTSDNIPF